MRFVALLLLTACHAHIPPIPGPMRTLAWSSRHDHQAPTSKTPDAPERRPSADPKGSRANAALGARVSDAARHYLAHPTAGFRQDCSGFVEATLARAGAPMRGSTRDLWAALDQQGATHRRTRPQPGDLAFFDNTYDRDDDGRTDDPLTHIAVVVSVDADGTIQLAHDGTSAGRATLYMNLLHPHDAKGPAGQPYNGALRAKRSADPAGTRYLAAELWHGFATVPAER